MKRWSQDLFTTVGFELGLIENLTVEHINGLNSNWCDLGLLDGVRPSKALQRLLQELIPGAVELLTSKQCRVAHGNIVSAGDMAFAILGGGPVLVEVEFHVCADGDQRTCVHVLASAPCANDARTGTRTFRYARNPSMIPSDWLLASAMFYCTGDMITAVLPACMR